MNATSQKVLVIVDGMSIGEMMSWTATVPGGMLDDISHPVEIITALPDIPPRMAALPDPPTIFVNRSERRASRSSAWGPRKITRGK